jgi:NADH-quinone oxidoreductase subunit N
MNTSLMMLEIAVALCGLAILLIDLWLPVEKRRQLGYFAAGAVALLLIGSFALNPAGAQYAFNNSYVLDPLALYFKRFFLLTAFFVLLMSVDFADRIAVGLSEFYAIVLFALCGMLFAASANDFILVFVSLELITVSFYVLNSFQRQRVKSVEAGVKYLILSALSTGFTLFGIALVFGTAQTTNFGKILANPALFQSKLFILGIFMVLVGLGFKISAFPFQIWAPDVYQGSPAPATAFLAVGSKAAGFVLLMRMLFGAVPNVAQSWNELLVVLTMVTILYGNLCAIPQRNLKRLLGYSSIGNAGYLLLGISATNSAGHSAVLYYLLGYLFTVIAAFFVISVVSRGAEDEDISMLYGLNRRSPLLATTLALSMISLAGIPPLAGFFGKFLLLKSVVERASDPLYWALIAVALFGIVTSFYYYLGVVRAIYWGKAETDLSPIAVATPVRFALFACIAGMLFLGIFPNPAVNSATHASASLAQPPALRVAGP